MKDLSHLPDAEEESNPLAVQPTNEFTIAFVNHWREEIDKRGDKPHATESSRIRGSWSGKCARQIAYHVQGVEPDNPITTAAFWRMEQGNIAHDYWQGAAKSLLGDDAEVESIATFMDGNGSLHTDLIVHSEKYGKVAFELKTVGGYKFKLAVGLVGKEPGPSPDHFLQGAVGAKAHDCDYLVICYISQENVNPKWAADAELHPAMEFSAEWMYPRETFMPYAEQEEKRFEAILTLVDQDDVASVPRYVPLHMPKGARIVDIGKAMWTKKDGEDIIDTGNVWGGKYCVYCPFNETCAADYLKENFD